MNLHTPERQPSESKAQYRERQADSREVVKTMTKGPTQAPAFNALDVSRFFLGQHTNPRRNRSGESGPRHGAQLAKFTAPRKRVQHKHKLQDEFGVYTLTGRRNLPAFRSLPTEVRRRIWLAGISARRGY